MTEQTRRATRLIEISRKLLQRPAGWSTAELARELGYSQRTVQRDLLDIQSEVGYPVVDAPGRRYTILPGSAPLLPVRLTLQEARSVYLAARLYARTLDEQDPDSASALDKLAETLPDAIGRQLEHTARLVAGRRPRRGYTEALRCLTDAWAQHHTVAMDYQSSGSAEPKTVHLNPYLLEPYLSGAYVMGFSHEHGEVRTFKLDRIKSVAETGDSFDPPDVDEIIEKLGHSWGVVYTGDEEFDITIDFTPTVARRVHEQTWHPAQKLIDLENGGVRLEVRLPSLLEIEPWIRGWGPEALVVGRPELRERVANAMRDAARRYEEDPRE
jgi:predicted DNA-binding transcriptional regulator YafY